MQSEATLPIKCSEVLVVGSSLDSDHSGPFGRFVEDLEVEGGDLAVRVVKVGSVEEFEHLFIDCKNKAKSGYCPLVHIDLHGSSDLGLAIGEKEFVSWKRLCELLAGVNEFTQNRLMVILFSCSGFHAIKKPDITSPAPFVLLAAPAGDVQTGKLTDTILPFYRELFGNGIDSAWPILRPDFQIFIPELIFRDHLVPEVARKFSGKKGKLYMEELISKSLEECPVSIGPTLKERRISFKRYRENLAEREIAQMKIYLCGRDPCFDVQKAIDEA